MAELTEFTQGACDPRESAARIAELEAQVKGADAANSRLQEKVIELEADVARKDAALAAALSATEPIAVADEHDIVSEDGYIRGYCIVSRVMTNHLLRFMTVFMDATTWKWIRPILVWRSPRSFMYAAHFDPDGSGRGLAGEGDGVVEVVGSWLDPKPKAPLERDYYGREE